MSTQRLPFLLCVFIFLCMRLPVLSQSWQWGTQASTHLYVYTVLDSHSSTISVAYAVSPSRVVLAKRDKYGNVIWSRNITNTSGTSVNSIVGGIVLDSWDNLYFISQPIAAVDGVQVNTPGSYALVKFNPSGHFVWARRLDASATIQVADITSSGNNIFISVSYNPSTTLTYDGNTYPHPGGNSVCSFVAGLDTAGKAKWTKRVYTQPASIFCNKSDAFPQINANNQGELLLTGRSTYKLYAESPTPVINTGIECKSFDYGVLLEGNSGNVKWAKTFSLDTLVPRKNTLTLQLYNMATLLHNGNTLLYRHLTTDTTVSATFSYSVELSSVLYQFDRNGILIRKDTLGKLGDWYQIFSLQPGDSSTFYSAGRYHNKLQPTQVYEVRKWDTGMHVAWKKRIDYSQYFPPFDPFREFSYRAKAFAHIIQVSPSNATGYMQYAYFGNDSLLPYGQILLARLVEEPNFISGTVFFDFNKNGIRDNNEPVAPGVLIGSANNDTAYAFSHRDGVYQFIVEPGNYSFKPLNLATLYPNFSMHSPDTHTAAPAETGNYIRSKNFALQAKTNITDGSISISYFNTPRPGNILYAKLIIRNTGNTPVSGNYKVVFDSTLLNFVKSDTTPVQITSPSLTIPVNTLPPLGTHENNIAFSVKTTATIHDTITIKCQLQLSKDDNPGNNIDSSLIAVRTSYDPNDKMAFPFKDVNYDSTVAGKQEIDYVIRFQNTGNDTAFAVQILDSLDKRLDISSFRLISSSHPVDIDWQNPRKLSFYFKDILLPDSNVNEPRSHGFVRFKIKAFRSVTLNDTVQNTADIYFDYNSPVKTNTISSNFLKKAAPAGNGGDNEGNNGNGGNGGSTGNNGNNGNGNEGNGGNPGNNGNEGNGNSTEPSLANDLSIKPNPVGGSTLFYKLTGSNVNEPMTVSIYDNAGRLVYTTARLVISNQEASINVSFLTKGIYYIVLRGQKETYQKSLLRL